MQEEFKAEFLLPAASKSKDRPSISYGQFFFQGRDKHNFEFTTAAEVAFLSIAAA